MQAYLGCCCQLSVRAVSLIILISLPESSWGIQGEKADLHTAEAARSPSAAPLPWLQENTGDIGQGNPLAVGDQMLPRTHRCLPGQCGSVDVWGRGRPGKARQLGSAAAEAHGAVWGVPLLCESWCGVYCLFTKRTEGISPGDEPSGGTVRWSDTIFLAPWSQAFIQVSSPLLCLCFQI